MTEPDRCDIGTALARLGADVRQVVPRPPASSLRRRAERQQRTRRLTAAAAVAALVGLVSVGTVTLTGGEAAPVPPIGPDPSVTAQPTGPPPPPRPRPARSVPPRSTPLVTDPIASTSWAGATVTLPAHEGCPSGAATLADWSAPAATFPRVTVDTERVRYGDLTGDGLPEAVLQANCWPDAEASGDGEGQLLVVRRDGAGLVALGWVGPRGALYVDHRVDGGVLSVDVRPWQEDWGHRLGMLRSYRWDGVAFSEVAGVDGIVPAAGAPGRAVDLRPVADWMGCPPAVPTFGPDGTAIAAGVVWDLVQPTGPVDTDPHPVDLTGGGEHGLLVQVGCGRFGPDRIGDASLVGGRAALVLLVPRSDGAFVAVDALPPPSGDILGWNWQEGALSLRYGDPELKQHYVWNGEYFQEGVG
nr:hypothetical protein [Micromonospora sp. DSM 115978]